MHLFLASAGFGGLLSALGIDWRSLLLNGAAFLVIVWLLGKYVYPSLVKALDAKVAELHTATRLEKDAEAHLEDAKHEAAKIMAAAQASAGDLLDTTRDEAEELAKQARQKAAAQAERIVADARAQLAVDVREAREQLRRETAGLVMAATEAVLAEKLDDKQDAKLVARSLDGQR